MKEGCENCPHPSDPHVLVTLDFDELAGLPDVPVAGVVLCPECDCVMTWSVTGFAAPEIPPEDELELLRRDVFKAPAGKARREVKEQDD